MRIGIDARMFGPSVGGGGLGRYVEQLVKELIAIDDENRYFLFLKPESVRHAPKAKHVELIPVDIHWYTLKEQLFYGRFLDRHQLDLLHFPHWNVPHNVRTPYVLTIHDLLLLDEPRSAKVSTRHPLIFMAKYAAYQYVLRRAIERAERIIAVSAFTKQSVLTHFPNTPEEKIRVIYEGVTSLPEGKPSAPPKRPFFLYVGNAYPHKNLEALLHAFSFFHKLHPDVDLVFAGRSDLFYDRLKKELEEISVPHENVRFVLDPSDKQLHALYRQATLFLIPSRIEGFGLPALEAMQAGTPVAASRGGSLPEVLGSAALYFSPTDIEEMVRVMEEGLTNDALRAELIAKGHNHHKRYSWKKMAQETHALYASTQKTRHN